MWTSYADKSDWIFCLVRTNTEVKQQAGITFILFDMDQPGVEVRPLREMTGQALFNEVFLDEARVPHDAVIGGLGAGWAVANTTLAVERASLGGGGRHPV